ncbi:putative nuclear RNA export factor SDE5 [Citrus sinensis]|nr:putative nuclear RNA export factor SDE5 isoform X1 [Citrus sinensis]XP_052300823.1 putative nuclear RNA export factor SDE5 isoform X1 [Citrus sinensis]KAH9666848.1 putative nuclear RNA export factor SDE5 [Citrus sinensis]
MPALCREETKQKQSKNDHLQKDTEDFLFKLLGEGSQLNRDVIQEVLDSCGFDMQKSMSKLIDRLADTLGKKTKFLGKSSEKCTDMCSNFGGPPHERKLQQLNSSGGHVKEDPNTNEGILPRHPKDRNELQKQVLLLYLVLLRNLMETEWRSKALEKVVSEPPEELAPECKANVVHLQQDNQTDNDEEDSLQALLRAMMEYRGTMKEHCKAAIDAFAQGDHVRAGKLLEQTRVHWKALPFSDACRIFAFKCPELKKLPLDLERAGQGKILIKGKEDWWKQLQWEDQVTQNALLPFLKQPASD